MSTDFVDHICLSQHVPAVNNQIFGYGQGLLPVESGVIGYKDQPLKFQMTRPYYIGSQLNFYNSIYFKSFDCSSISRRIAEFHFDAVNTEAFDSVLTTLTLGNVSSQDNSAVNIIDGLQYFKYLENFQCVIIMLFLLLILVVIFI